MILEKVGKSDKLLLQMHGRVRRGRETITLIFQGKRGKPIFSSPIFLPLIINSAATRICNLPLLCYRQSGQTNRPPRARGPKIGDWRVETLSNHADERSNRIAAATFSPGRKNATFVDDQNQPRDLDVGQFGPLIMMRPHSSPPPKSK